MIFCSKCGTQLGEDSVFCSKCGTKKIELVQSQGETKYQEKVSKIMIVFGALSVIWGVASSNFFTIFLGVSFFVIGFVSLNTKSKPIKQLMKYILLILMAISIINLVNLLTQI